MDADELREKIKLAKLIPDVAHSYAFGLVLPPYAKGPVCKLCGSTLAPIVGGIHLDGWCVNGPNSEKRN